jgi:hypothetical protein
MNFSFSFLRSKKVLLSNISHIENLIEFHKKKLEELELSKSKEVIKDEIQKEDFFTVKEVDTISYKN